MKKIILITLITILACGCSYVEQEKFNVKTESGEIVTFLCPVIDESKPKMSYFYNGDCKIIKEYKVH